MASAPRAARWCFESLHDDHYAIRESEARGPTPWRVYAWPRPHLASGSGSRAASPNRFTARIVTVIAVPGNTTIHHGGLKASARTPPSMLPQLGVGGGTPTPTKLSAARNAGARLLVLGICCGGYSV